MTTVTSSPTYSTTATAGSNFAQSGGLLSKNESDYSGFNGALSGKSDGNDSAFNEALGDSAEDLFGDVTRRFADSLDRERDSGAQQEENHQDPAATVSSTTAGHGGYTQSQADHDAAALYDAMLGGLTGWMTDEDRVIGTLEGKSSKQVQMMRESFDDHYKLSLDEVVKDDFSGDELKRVESLLAGDSYQTDAADHQDAPKAGFPENPPSMQAPASPKQQAEASAERLHQALAGWRINDGAVRSELSGKSRTQINLIAAVYHEKYDCNLRDDLTSELGGRDEFEIVDQIFDKGAIDPNDPEAAQKTVARLREQQEFESGLGSHMVDSIQKLVKGESDGEILERNLARAEAAIRNGDTGQAKTLAGYAGDDFNAFQKSKDSLADGAATVGATTGAVVGIAAVEFFSVGTATPFLVTMGAGALGGAGGRATTYMAIEGNAADGQETMRQGIIGAVEGGTVMLPVGKGATAAGQALKEGAEHGVGKVIVQGAKEGAVGGAASGAADASTRSETWENGVVDGLVTVGQKTALDGTIGAVTGAGVSGAMAKAPEVWHAAKDSLETVKKGISEMEIPNANHFGGLEPAMAGGPGELAGRQTVGDIMAVAGEKVSAVSNQVRQKMDNIAQAVGLKDAPASDFSHNVDATRTARQYMEDYQGQFSRQFDQLGVDFKNDLQEIVGHKVEDFKRAGGRSFLKESGYNLRKNAKGNGGDTVYRLDKENHLKLTVNGEGRIVPANMSEVARFPKTGLGNTVRLDTDKILAALEKSDWDTQAAGELSKPFESYANMLETHDIATRDELRAALDEMGEDRIAEKTIDAVRHELKSRKFNALGDAENPISLQDRIQNHLKVGEELSSEASHKKLLSITGNLGPADKGTIAEQWYYNNFCDKSAVTQVKVSAETFKLDKDRRIDILEGNTLHEVKHIAGGLGKHDKEQFADFMKLVSEDEGAKVGEHKVDKAVYTFVNPKGVEANAGWMQDALTSQKGLSFEIFNNSGEIITVGLKEIKNQNGEIIQQGIDFLDSANLQNWMDK